MQLGRIFNWRLTLFSSSNRIRKFSRAYLPNWYSACGGRVEPLQTLL
jgi:hypothetical protein